MENVNNAAMATLEEYKNLVGKFLQASPSIYNAGEMMSYQDLVDELVAIEAAHPECEEAL